MDGHNPSPLMVRMDREYIATLERHIAEMTAEGASEAALELLREPLRRARARLADALEMQAEE